MFQEVAEYFIMSARHQQLQRGKSGEGREMREGGEPKHEVAKDWEFFFD